MVKYCKNINGIKNALYQFKHYGTMYYRLKWLVFEYHCKPLLYLFFVVQFWITIIFIILSEKQFLKMLFNVLKFLKLIWKFVSSGLWVVCALSSSPEEKLINIHIKNNKIRITCSGIVFQKNDKDNNDSEFNN